MHWLQTQDIELFRFINHKLMNPVLDVLMPFLSGNAFFYPALLVLGILLIWKGGARGIICVLMLGLVLGIGDGWICNTLKHAFGRERPFMVLPEVHLPPGIGKSGSGSLPSTHAANWFAATMVALVYYRRSLWFTLPSALAVSFSRIYNGVHYPSDVLAGAILGAGYAAAIMLLLDWFWNWAGRKWFPLWWRQMPSLMRLPPKSTAASESEIEPDAEEPEIARASAVAGQQHPRLGRAAVSAESGDELHPQFPKRPGIAPTGFRAPHVALDEHWLRLGYVCLGVLLVARLLYIAGHTIQLASDEAYQWVWSKHLALSYYSKPPLIAYTQFLGTSLWGDTVFGVRFFSPMLAAFLGLMVLRFFAREINARAGFFLVLIVTATPLLAAGSILMTVDPLSVLFWTAAMLAGWRAVQDRSTAKDWLWVGLWMGLGFLSKYTALLQWVSWALVFVLWAPARKQLRRPGPYLAFLVNALCALPVLIWNAQHGWITVFHVADDAGAGEHWEPTLRYVRDFLGSEAALLNPIFFGAMVWAAVAMWRRGGRNPKLVYFFCMGAPVFLTYFLWSFRSRILPNWIAPSVLPLFFVMVIYWDTRLRLGLQPVRAWCAAGLILGFLFVLAGHNTDLVRKLTGHYLPVRFDPLHRVREWDASAGAVEHAREALETEGKPVFIITDHYDLAGQFSFWLPQARTNIRTQPLVYYRTSATPENQFYFWGGYTSRKGENAIFVRELDRGNPAPAAPPPRLEAEFDSVTEIGVSNILYHGEYLLRPLQLFACRGLK